MLKERGLKFQLLSFAMLLNVFLVATGLGAVYSQTKIAASYSKVTQEILPASNHLAEMRVATKEVILNIMNLCLPGISKADSDRALQNLKDVSVVFETNRQNYLKQAADERQQALVGDLFKAWTELDETQTQMLYQAKSTDAEERALAIKTLNGDFKVAYQNLFAKIDQLARAQNEQASQQVAAAKEQERFFLSLTVALVVIGFALSLVVGILFSSTLSRKFLGLVQVLSAGAEKVAVAAVQISSSSARVAQSATEQESTIQATCSSVEEVEAMIRSNAESAKASSEMSSSNLRAASDGKLVVDQMVASMDGIKASNQLVANQVELSNQKISGIVAMIREIADKTKIINEIVFQTKLLSFNASVEAVRAGENGRGFAVVAQEVGNLAKLSGDASKGITDLLRNSVEVVEGIVAESRAKVGGLVASADGEIERGAEIAGRCSELLAKIVTDSGLMKEMVNQISLGSQEQAGGARQIASAMTQLEASTAQNNIAVHESEATSAELRSQAAELRQVAFEMLGAIRGHSRSEAVEASARVDADADSGPESYAPAEPNEKVA